MKHDDPGQPASEPIDVQVEGDKDASPFYREVLRCERNHYGHDPKRLRVVIEPRVGDCYVDAWSELHTEWRRVHSMKWGHPLAEVKPAADLGQDGKYQASDFKACRDELVRLALVVLYG